MKYQKWNIGTAAEEDVAHLCSAGYPALLSTVLAARGINTLEAAAEALEHERQLSHSPMLMKDMDKAVARIQQAISAGETIAVFGDYDVDGITPTVLLSDYLKSCGANCLRYIPRRIDEGYGLSQEAIRFLRNQGATLMVTVDCGITGNEEIAFASSIGMDVVVTDHHECKEILPPAVAVVDPHRPDCPYPFKHLAGVGVALKLVLALGGENREDALFSRYCTLASIGTIADVMRMEGENRTIVSCGLESLDHADFVGIHALLREAGLLGKPITSIQIGFVLAPRINAAGRMGAADLAADLLEESDPAVAEVLARQLCDLNRERQEVEQAICVDAIKKIERLRAEERNALVLSSEEWHQGVVGIVASRLSEKYAAPSFMIHLKDGSGKGSCRSYGGFNLFAALESCSDLLEGFGGHELAAGFTIAESNIDAFRVRMNRYVRSVSGGERPVSSLDIDAAITNPADMTLEQVDHLAQLEPYGAGNPRPVFALLGATVDSVATVGQGKHLKLRLSKGPNHFDAIFFSVPDSAQQIELGSRVDVAFYLQANTFRNNTTLQLQLVDIRPSLSPSHHEAESLSLLQRLVDGLPLTPQEISRLQASRDQFSAYWRILDRHLKQGKAEVDLLPYLRSLAAQVGGNEGFLRAALALLVFDERGLISIDLQDSHLTLCLNPISGKVDLFASPYLSRLHNKGGAAT
ncbi:MAG: single-stranded-DNA-specific exonuclease RecJ [Oscillibacter sp.]|nr:single-stranded-DNA-specific exonuclease RecJ [Oscillibacter sp.]